MDALVGADHGGGVKGFWVPNQEREECGQINPPQTG